jgi:hypothetical protein
MSDLFFGSDLFEEVDRLHRQMASVFSGLNEMPQMLLARIVEPKGGWITSAAQPRRGRPTA